jgi:outer membrane protein OmpA-like peptidoglycan-associated protein
MVGEKSNLTANFTGQCGGTIRSPKFSASEGSVSGDTFDSTGVQFGPSGSQQKTVTITAKASDDKETGEATTTVVVKRNPQAARLPDVLFAKGSARVNNCGKRVLLEQLKTYLDQDPGGKVIFVGHAAPKEPKAAHLDRKRAENSAAVISAHKGICLGFPASQILISEAGTSQQGASFQPYFCGPSTSAVTERAGQKVSEKDKDAQLRRVEVWFVPSGAEIPSSVGTTKDAAAYGISKLGCPK